MQPTQDANNYTAYPWVLSANMTIPVPDDGTLFAQGKALMGASFHPWVGELTLVVGAMALVAALKVMIVSMTMGASFLHVS